MEVSQMPSLDVTPYPVGARSSLASLTPKYSFSADPRDWGSSLSRDLVESDDEQYTSEECRKWRRNNVSIRGAANIGCLSVLLAGFLALFIGYPVFTFYDPDSLPKLGGTNATGQIPHLIGNFGLIDQDTPDSAYTIVSRADGRSPLQLIFSDEFDTDGRSFYPGDDPYWEAVDLHYWATGNLEWYDPGAITTQNGSLVITLSQKDTHGLNYEGGLVSTWNKFCFTGGYVEVNVQLPGANNVLGFWPAIWSVGNLGRAGYGATLEGVWPYSYDSCDVGTVANQTLNGLPAAATAGGDQSKGGALSYLPGQRLSRCTCEGEDHPGPKHSDGTWVGRSAPEIDVFEAQVNKNTFLGEVSQSAQWAPFDTGQLNTFTGTATQQATSVVTQTDFGCYESDGGCYSIYGFEVRHQYFAEALRSIDSSPTSVGFDNGYITWISSGQPSWTLKSPGMGANANVQIGARPVSTEPMYLIMNLGMSRSFGDVDLDHLTFPAHMMVDYIRVYQPKNAINIGCDPKGFPTKDYIERHIGAYINPNLTTWVADYRQKWPANSFLGQC
ncbi:glycoside hydrolase family 16 protein [Pholiota conissans]|uniref:Glycoside hydrolase family 16 protein n=1 Tax=Pholiota conissans TaxID=109636 RepID=A0A9P5YRL8_9AGAR|nr:glycoside hydrolase family 16 protein [Pholiota conissans]